MGYHEKMKIRSLFYYPIKSCAALETDRLRLETEGPLWDREWMIVDAQGMFVTQREIPTLALVRPRLEKDKLLLSGPGGELTLPLSNEGKASRQVVVWGDTVKAWDEGPAASRWLTDAFGKQLFLVRIAGKRQAGRDKSRSVRFPDAYPLHLCSIESLADLNSRLTQPVEMTRFRPNLVIEGAPAFAEDGWAGIRIGEWEFPIGAACKRCSVTMVDPETGERGLEPMRTLSGFRKKDKKVEFGQYLLSVDGAELQVGMEVVPVGPASLSSLG
jgi:uncharacterized protein